MKHYNHILLILLEVAFVICIYGCRKVPVLPSAPVYDNPLDTKSPGFDAELFGGNWIIVNEEHTYLYSQKAILRDSTFFLVGGIDITFGFPVVTNDVQYLDLDSFKLHGGYNMISPRLNPSIVLSYSDIFVFGGDSASTFEAHYFYDFSAPYWEKKVLPSSKLGFGTFASVYKDGNHKKIFLGGGKSLTNEVSDEMWIYFPELFSWSLLTKLPEPLFGATMQIVEKQLFVIGGFNNSGLASSKIYVYNLDSLNWKEFPDTLRTARGNSVSLVKGERLFVFGGEISLGITSNAVDEINISKQNCVSRSPIPSPMLPYGVGLYDGDALLIGGTQGSLKVLKYEHPYLR